MPIRRCDQTQRCIPPRRRCDPAELGQFGNSEVRSCGTGDGRRGGHATRLSHRRSCRKRTSGSDDLCQRLACNGAARRRLSGCPYRPSSAVRRPPPARLLSPSLRRATRERVGDVALRKPGLRAGPKRVGWALSLATSRFPTGALARHLLCCERGTRIRRGRRGRSVPEQQHGGGRSRLPPQGIASGGCLRTPGQPVEHAAQLHSRRTSRVVA